MPAVFAMYTAAGLVALVFALGDFCSQSHVIGASPARFAFDLVVVAILVVGAAVGVRRLCR